MSIPVELPDLQAKTSEYTWAYLLTVRPDATPHLVSVSTQWSAAVAARADVGAGPGTGTGTGTDTGTAASSEEPDDRAALFMSVSVGTATNATAGSVVTLCYPPLDHDGYSLIIDGTASVVEVNEATTSLGTVPDGKALLRFAPTGAVLHRSAAPGFVNSATGCANDCRPLDARAEPS